MKFWSSTGTQKKKDLSQEELIQVMIAQKIAELKA